MNISLPHTQKGSKCGSLAMIHVPKSTKLILEAKQQLKNDVVQHSFIICLYTSICGSPFEISKKTKYLRTEAVSYNVQYTHILDELTSYIMGRKKFSSFLQIIYCCIHGLQLV